MESLKPKVEELERQTKGLAKSLDKVKGEVDVLKTQTAEVKGIALSADRGYHHLTGQVESVKGEINSLKANLKDFIETQKEANKDHVKANKELASEVQAVRKQNFKNMLWLMGYIFVLLGFMFTVFTYIFTHLGSK